MQKTVETRNTASGDPARLLELRAKIDAIDESVHRLLMQRASVIDALIEVKGTVRDGAAFRPGREASMMREIAARHQGHLPIATIEHFWREIISTFTHLQAPYEVVTCPFEGDLVASVETARFYFGFTVPVTLADATQDVVARIEEGGDRLGVLPLDGLHPWWQGLRNAAIVCALPFIDTEDHPIAKRAVVIAPPLADPVTPEIGCWRVDGLKAMAGGGEDMTILAQAPYGTGLFSALIATRHEERAIRTALGEGIDLAQIGGFAPPLHWPYSG
ncbi:chorismate mutase [Fulvimarina sp. 2208YS6-2-32]|uniref:chorismate mutase n=1 Tax=Fulvimarina uroteuthidis TaxID=3098149 RepID=A0ABU5I319_9HYPH|nr:chorismate mutase [Fulvimarina sp. 2208YS6-2-32]MDY8109759.1 chorismate mutase [Fulvimarina sp. 2208YS6-2-32]